MSVFGHVRGHVYNLHLTMFSPPSQKGGKKVSDFPHSSGMTYFLKLVFDSSAC